MCGIAGAVRSFRHCVVFASAGVATILSANAVAALDDPPPQPPRLTLISQIDPASGTRHNSDVWGWVDPATDKEYAIVGEWQGNRVYIIDVSDAGNPFVAGTINGTSGQDVKTWDHYLYTVSGSGNVIGGRIWDISDPTQPVDAGAFESGHNITIVDGFMYKSIPGMRIYDLRTQPANPQFQWWNGLSGSNGHDATVVGNVLYDFGGPVGTTIWDVTDKTQPVQMGFLPRNGSGVAYHHNGAPSVDGRYLYITDELSGSGDPDITVWDITNPQNFVLVNGFTDPNATVHNVFVVGDLLIASFYVAGVRVFDISTPSDPILLDTYDTSPGYTGNGLFNGCWGVYPFAPSGVIYASDIENGLFLFSFPGVTVAVAITAFDAVYDDGAVRLRWEIGSADQLEGFRIYRSEIGESGFAPIHSGLISPEIGNQYTDRDVRPGATYWYRLGAIDRDGEFQSPTQKVVVPEAAFTLAQNYPNPFNPSTTIDYDLSRDGEISLVVFNPAGQVVRTLVSGTQSIGPHHVTWDGVADNGERVSSGVYFYRLTATGRSETRRMILLK